jgi:hypothetical protein
MITYVVEIDGGEINILDAAGNKIDPAKEGTLGDVKTILAAIRDTAGVKKITDPLPAGDNNIGNVDAIQSGAWTVQQGTPPWAVKGSDAGGAPPTQNPVLAAGQDGTNVRAHKTDSVGRPEVVGAALAGSPPSGAPVLLAGWDGTNVRTVRTNAAGRAEWVLFDSAGNAVGVILDGAVYRLQTSSKVARGATDLVELDALDTAAGRGRLKMTLYSPEGDAIAFSSVPPSAASIRNDFVKNGGAESLLVDGSGTARVFSYNAHATQDVSLQEIKFVMVSNSVTFGSNAFGSAAGPLVNGLLVEVVAGGVAGTIQNLKQNESFIYFSPPGGFEWVVSSKDMMSSTYLIGGGLKLKAGTGDMVRVTVRDNIVSAAVYFKCWVKGNLLTAA